MVASRAFYAHNFPAPHHGSVESFVDNRLMNDVVTGAKMVEEARRSGRSPAAAGAAGLVVA